MASIQELSIYSPQYSFEFPRRQQFSLPGSFIHYISQNWSGFTYEKLIQTCKHFFARHQIVPMESVEISLDSWDYDKIKFLLFKDKISIDLKKTKLWIYCSVRCYDNNFPFSSLLKSVYRCTPIYLCLLSQDIDFNDFAKISANIKDIDLHCNTALFFPDKTKASLWDILGLMPKLEKYYTFFNEENFLSFSMKNITIPILPNLKKFNYSNFPKNDFPAIVEFIKLHPNTKFRLGIEEEITEIEVIAFKTILEKAFPHTTITQNRHPLWVKDQWTLEINT